LSEAQEARKLEARQLEARQLEASQLEARQLEARQLETGGGAAGGRVKEWRLMCFPSFFNAGLDVRLLCRRPAVLDVA
jgi:hypothetical protein